MWFGRQKADWILGTGTAQVTVCVWRVRNPGQALSALSLQKSSSRDTATMKATCTKSISYSFGTWRCRVLQSTEWEHYAFACTIHCHVQISSFMSHSYFQYNVNVHVIVIFLPGEYKSPWCSTISIDPLSTYTRFIVMSWTIRWVWIRWVRYHKNSESDRYCQKYLVSEWFGIR